MGDTAYFHRTMPDSPKGREIERIDDSGQRIVTRATQIESLGERMLRAADTLKLMVDGQFGKGLSLYEGRRALQAQRNRAQGVRQGRGRGRTGPESRGG